MTRRFVIQGSPTLNGIAQFVLPRVITGIHTIQQQVLSTFFMQNYYCSTMNLLIFYIPVSDYHTIQYTAHEYLLSMIALM